MVFLVGRSLRFARARNVFIRKEFVHFIVQDSVYTSRSRLLRWLAELENLRSRESIEQMKCKQKGDGVELSVVVPTYNERANVPEVIARLEDCAGADSVGGHLCR